MPIELSRLKDHFDHLFKEGGLTNIKFFVDPRTKSKMNQSEFISELEKIQAVKDEDCEVIKSVDKDQEKHSFREFFALNE